MRRSINSSKRLKAAVVDLSSALNGSCSILNMFILSIFLYHLFVKTSAFPVQNTVNQTSSSFASNQNQTGSLSVGWYSPPNLRGTFDLLISCLTTLALCAWTAYHPNVHSGRSQLQLIGHRILWMVIAVFVPEIVLFCAWDQWWASRRLKEEINALGEGAFNECLSKELDDERIGGNDDDDDDDDVCWGCAQDHEEAYHLDMLFEDQSKASTESVRPQDLETAPSNGSGDITSTIKEKRHFWRRRSTRGSKGSDPDKSQPSHKWTTEQAFFALSGGFAIPTPYHHRRQLTLTLCGLQLFARLGLLPATAPASVSDKSKADTVAKILVCIQAGWFFVQCIARVAQKLPLTLLELHVLTHVLCAFAMYVLWIEKPYDVGAPIMCDSERAKDFGALFGLDDGMGYEEICEGNVWKCPYASPTIAISEIRGTQNLRTHQSSIIKYLHLCLKDVGLKRPSQTAAPKTQAPSSEKQAPPTETMKEHLTRANRALQYLKDRKVHFPYLSKSTIYAANGIGPPAFHHTDPKHGDEERHVELATSIHIPTKYAVSTRSNLLIDGRAVYRHQISDVEKRKKDRFRLTQITMFGLTSTLYGALHLLAWSRSHFPTMLETWLWRGSALTMISGPVFTFLLLGSMNLSRLTSTKKSKSPWMRAWAASVNGLEALVMYLVVFPACVAWAAYPIARLYVLVESFVGLRSVGEGIYRTVEWSGFVPHVG
ncbi:hypothetical protein BCR34DRAFT_60443 [Clohesyomyces aquaticus]|uniref:Uncharacterized protein n=1 Tax=Clohesyomyces aquaticus TaxID=1231657 RepID=A0A1Y2A3I9_9PLEO|nr:hypothetical protein BCR34DRAFT_60443 [Clohesyomyces aquaticus]